MWLARGGPPDKKAVWYEYHSGRGSEHAINILSGFKGYFQTDGFSAYVTAAAALPLAVHVGCWAHARKRFYEAAQLRENAAESREGLSWIQKLYMEKPLAIISNIFLNKPLL
jgi:transposase